MRILFSADLHGNLEQYRRLFHRALQPNIGAVVIGGDIAPKRQPSGTFIAAQREFVKKDLKSVISEAKARKPGLGVYLMLGNDDARSIEQDLRVVCRETGAHYIHGRRHRLDESTEIVGYSCVPITPFGIKDWEKHDVSRRDESIREWEARLVPGERNRLDGVVSDGDGWRAYRIPAESAPRDSIQNDLERPEFTKDAPRTVYVIHTPPAITALDRIARGHVGSVAVRQFIQKYRPLLTLHGHIHETVDLSRRFAEPIGPSISISCGNHDTTPYVAAVIVDTGAPEKAVRQYL